MNTWHGYEGFNRVSEAEFFQIAGIPAEAERARQYRLEGAIWSVVVGALYAGVISLMLASGSKRAGFYWEIGFGLVGVVPLSIGLSRLIQNWSTAEQANSAALTRNEEIESEIRGDSDSDDFCGASGCDVTKAQLIVVWVGAPYEHEEETPGANRSAAAVGGPADGARMVEPS